MVVDLAEARGKKVKQNVFRIIPRPPLWQGFWR